ncbi:uncharacterized protein LOC111362008 [Spodoptera litura]|uniref:Uncharacterized protein LOC111362008 n=1 Tax=Spodoptera litura TaxID=69820 RepID=A0A9J7ERZ9_SPOLT|nr:uncharacterized protein LOC111362008 [Spodoptera litura]
MKSHAVPEAEYDFKSLIQSPVKRKEKIQRNSAMSSKTKDFIQKICYKQTASIDMTQYGFINDSKMNPINLMMKPLRAQLEKICVKANKKSSSPSRSPPHKEPSPSGCMPKSALSNPKTKYISRQLEDVQNEDAPTVKKKKVTLIVPSKKVKKNLTVKWTPRPTQKSEV